LSVKPNDSVIEYIAYIPVWLWMLVRLIDILN